MSNVLAAIGCATVDTADDVIQKRLENVLRLYSLTFLKLIKNNWYYPVSPHCYPVLYKNEKIRNKKLLELSEAGIEGRKLFSCLPVTEKVYSYMGYKKGDFPVAEDIGNRGLFVPVHQDLSPEDIKKIGDIL
jgi:dTDP-4-amino-4,6-dideoxygalactose transaminase